MTSAAYNFELLIKTALEDGTISAREAQYLVDQHNHLQVKSRSALIQLLSKHGYIVHEQYNRIIPLSNLGIPLTSTQPRVSRLPEPDETPMFPPSTILEDFASVFLNQRHVPPRTKQKLVFIAITGSTALFSLIKLLSPLL